jgi:putative nucleotidyltransferase with HDIG domain
MMKTRAVSGKFKVFLFSLHPGLRRRMERATDGLSPWEKSLVLSLNRYDAAHSLLVRSALEENGVLRKAALLHDCGKLRKEAGIVSRWLYAALNLFSPRRLERVSLRLDGEARGNSRLDRAMSLPRGWKRGLYVLIHHAEIGAELLRAAGTEEEVAALVEGHHREPCGRKGRLLAEADGKF